MVADRPALYARDMGSTIGSAVTRDGVELLTRHWASPTPPWAGGLIVHGLSEHSGRYEHVGGWLARAGIEVHAYDQRGWGGSGGLRGDIERWEDLTDDLAERLAAVRSATPAGIPVVLYGHSMGGLVAMGYVLGGRPLPDLLVLSAPGIDSTHSRGLRLLASACDWIVPTFRPPTGTYDGGRLSRDPAVGQAFRVDPLAVHDPTARFAAAAFTAQRAARERLDRMRAAGEPFPVRTLVIHGTDDPIVPITATERCAAFPEVTRVVYPGLRHELHNEPEGEAIVGDIIAWLRAQAGAAGARLAS